MRHQFSMPFSHTHEPKMVWWADHMSRVEGCAMVNHYGHKLFDWCN
jgi:hypothetical protein